VALIAKARVVTEVCAVAVLLAVAGGIAGASQRPTLAEVSALLGASLTSVAVVTSVALRLSVDRPHAADLRAARDTPAPPGTMAAYSALLAVRTTLLGLLFAALARLDDPTLPLLATVPVLLLTVRSLLRTARRWDDPVIRSRVVATVTHG
jgi:hypothetical protein